MAVVYDQLLNKPLLHNHKTWWMQSADGSIWDISIDNTGALVSTKRVVSTVGTPMGLLLSLTYAT